MEKNSKKISFNEYDFLRLFSAILIIKKHQSIIINTELEKRLNKYYKMPEFKLLFKDIIKNSFIDLKDAFQMAYTNGLINLFQDTEGVKSIINLTKEEALLVASEYDDEYIVLMSRLISKLFNEILKSRKDNKRVMIGSGENTLFITKNGDKCMIGEGENSCFINVDSSKKDADKRIDEILYPSLKEKTRRLCLFKKKKKSSAIKSKII